MRASINRNIVECKVVSDSPAEVMAFVLIETLWNVKHILVPCVSVVPSVLIETLWNVKSEVKTPGISPVVY